MHPRDRFITVYGRKPVLEVLADPAVEVDKVVLATNARDRSAEAIVEAAEARGLEVRREPAERVTRLSHNGRHDQGVVADVVAPQMRDVGQVGEAERRVLVLDGITNPANVGMILRTATAAGLDGVVVPRRGTADLGPLVVKASAGVAFRAPILRTLTTEDALASLQDAGFALVGLDAAAGRSLFDLEPPERCAFVLGGETHGVTPEAARWVHEWVAIPMAGGVESLNVASAATLVAYELASGRTR